MITSQNNTVSEELVNKVRKLLSLAQSDNLNESSLALEKARKLGVEYNIDLASINIHEKQKEEPVVKGDSINNGKRETTCQKYINWLLVEHFNVRIVHSGGRYSGRTMTLIGKKMDIDMSIFINNYLNEEMPRLWKKYYDSTPGCRLEEKQSYLYGIHQGLSAKIAESQKNTEFEKFEFIKVNKGTDELEKVKECYALTIKSTKEKLEEKLYEYYPNLRSKGSVRLNLNSHNALNDGESAGRNISLARPLGYSGKKSLT